MEQNYVTVGRVFSVVTPWMTVVIAKCVQYVWFDNRTDLLNSSSSAPASIIQGAGRGLSRVARFSTTKYGRFLSADPSKSSPPDVSIYNSVHVATRTQIPHKQ